MIRNLQTRFILFIILIATFSGCFSLVLSYLFYGNSIENTMKQNQTKIAQNILLLHNETDFPLEKIISIDFTNEYELTVLDDISNYKTSDKTQNSNIIYKTIIYTYKKLLQDCRSFLFYSSLLST